jgi:hypothetical protein
LGKLILLVNKEGLVKERHHPISPKNKELTEDILQKLIFEEPKLHTREVLSCPIERKISSL